MTNPKREKIKLSIFRNNRGNHCIFSAIEKIRGHYKQFYIYKSENLKKKTNSSKPTNYKMQLRWNSQSEYSYYHERNGICNLKAFEMKAS